ncbi:unnamed protein product, partial [Candidula unifasciata]
CLVVHGDYIDCARIRRVVGGQPLEVGSWPWLVSLNYRQHHDYLVLQGLQHLCGGTLINESWILTAAHCVYSIPAYPGLGESQNWIAVLGEYNRGIPEQTEQRIEIDQIFLKNYTIFPRLLEDIALLKLKRPAHISSSVRSVALDMARTIPNGTRCRAAGWGQHTADEPGEPQYGNGTMIPHVVVVQRIPDQTCLSLYGQTWPAIDDRSMCFSSEDRQDTCKGDSGGPLICDIPGGQPAITGIVSLGVGCGMTNYPGIYTRVSSYSDWIAWTIANF